MVCLMGQSSGQLLPFLRRHLLRIGSDAYPAQIQSVGIETCVDGGITRTTGGGMETTGFLKQFKLTVGQVFQKRIAQAVHQLGGSWAVLLIIAVILTAAVVQVGKETDDGQVTFGCGQLQTVLLNALPMGDAMSFSQGPAVNRPLLYLVDVDHFRTKKPQPDF